MTKKTVSLSLKVTPDVKSRIQACAKTKERSLNWLATKYIQEGLERDEPGGADRPNGQKRPKPC